MPETHFLCKCGARWSAMKTCPLCSQSYGWERREAHAARVAAEIERERTIERLRRQRERRSDPSLTIAQRNGWEHDQR